MVCLNHTPPSGDSNDPKGLKHPFETTPGSQLVKAQAGRRKPARSLAMPAFQRRGQVE
ncbi:hypothetical protein CBM2589_A10029 [Cupriavidus taiwanensis]|uniref:Uncharacterized protein n=1 Tax=Cupriavidus taiwanensis TaxID=164546 RepID=A0A375BY50_9BURK|nr:hypothetical protein CBM2589_A10029 [Cupriavidus taiwanensis]